LAAKAGVIVSGDRYLLNLGNFKKTRILAPKALIASLEKILEVIVEC
jgi:predicted nucleic acid-binding protein